MTTLLISHRCHADHGADIAAAAARADLELELLALPAGREARLAAADCARIDIAYFSEDVFPDFPRDLVGQTVLIFGLGRIGSEIARLAQVLGLKVIGVRRSPLRAGEPVDELHPPQRLAELLPRADWLIIASPLTAETRGLIDAVMLARLPAGARIINIARGEIIDETMLTAALREQRLAGAYLDVFAQDPLAVDSPLWDLPNVIVSPHNAAAASGNDGRVYRMFLENLGRWHRGETLAQEVRKPWLKHE